MAFANPYLSYSRLSRFEQCPLSYKLHYIDKQHSEPGIALQFGKLVHAVLEQLLLEVIREEHTGPLSTRRAIELFREAWNQEALTGIEAFQEGLQILREFVRVQGPVDHRDILATEKEFRIRAGRFTVLGYIDRIDWVDDDTVRVIDYKTNRQLFTRDDVDHSLQLSLYQVAAKQLYPWAKRIELVFWMLRHGVWQQTARTDEQLDDALAYVETLGEQTERASEFPARLNTNCNYCDHRRQCPAYADALEGKREEVCTDLEDLEAVAKEREEVARVSKVLLGRKDELDQILKTHLKHQDELVLAGTRYRLFNAASLDYPLERTVQVLSDATGRSPEELTASLGRVDKKALDRLLKETGKHIGRPQLTLLKAELESCAKKTHTPRVWAKREVA